MLEMTFFVTGWPFFVRCICTHALVARMHLRADPVHGRRCSPALSMANTAMMTERAWPRQARTFAPFPGTYASNRNLCTTKPEPTTGPRQNLKAHHLHVLVLVLLALLEVLFFVGFRLLPAKTTSQAVYAKRDKQAERRMSATHNKLLAVSPPGRARSSVGADDSVWCGVPTWHVRLRSK